MIKVITAINVSILNRSGTNACGVITVDTETKARGKTQDCHKRDLAVRPTSQSPANAPPILPSSLCSLFVPSLRSSQLGVKRNWKAVWRPRHRGEENIKNTHKKLVGNICLFALLLFFLDGIHAAQYRDKWREFVNVLINLNWGNVSYSGRTLFLGRS
jgi:hypothetical protein